MFSFLGEVLEVAAFTAVRSFNQYTSDVNQAAAMGSIKLVDLPEVERLSPRVIRVLGCNPGEYELQGTNTYLVGTGPEVILIDASDRGNWRYQRLLKKVLAEHGLTIVHILVTHHHGDHLGGVPGILKNVLSSTTNCPASKTKNCSSASSSSSSSSFSSSSDDQKMIADDGVIKPCTSSPSSTLKVTKIKSSSSSTQDAAGFAPNGYDFVKHGHRIAVQGAMLRVIHTPGHTDDHMALYLEEEQAVFSGDCILGQTKPVFENMKEYIKSLGAIKRQNPVKIYPGHGPVLKNPQMTINQYFGNIERRERLVIDCLKKSSVPLSTSQIVSKIYLDISFMKRFGAAMQVNNHLKMLQDDGIVRSNEHQRWTLLKQFYSPKNYSSGS